MSTLRGAAEIGKALGEDSGKYKVDKHFPTTITDTMLSFERNQASIDAETPWTAPTCCAPRHLRHPRGGRDR